MDNSDNSTTATGTEAGTETSPKKTRAKATGPKAVNTTFLEKLRLSMELSPSQFLQAMLDFEVANPTENLKASVLNFVNANRGIMKSRTSGGNSASAIVRRHKEDIQLIFTSGASPIQNATFVKASNSRKHKTIGFYSVKVKYSSGTEASFYVDVRDRTAIQFYMPDGEGTVGTTISLETESQVNPEQVVDTSAAEATQPNPNPNSEDAGLGLE